MNEGQRKTAAVAAVLVGIGVIFVLFNQFNLTGAATLDTSNAVGNPIWLFGLLGAAIYVVVAVIRKGKD